MHLSLLVSILWNLSVASVECDRPARVMKADDYDAIAVPYIQAKKKIQGGFNEDAIALLRKLTTATPSFVIGYRALGVAYQNRSNWTQAYTNYSHVAASELGASIDKKFALDQMVSITPKHPAIIHYERALRFFAERRFRESTEAAKAARDAKADFALPYRIACLSHARLNEAAPALRACKEYISVAEAAPDRDRFADILQRSFVPLSSDIQDCLDRATMAVLNDQPAVALQTLQSALQQKKDVPALYRAQARAARDLGNRKLALQSYQAFLSFFSDDESKKSVERSIEELQ